MEDDLADLRIEAVDGDHAAGEAGGGGCCVGANVDGCGVEFGVLNVQIGVAGILNKLLVNIDDAVDQVELAELDGADVAVSNESEALLAILLCCRDDDPQVGHAGTSWCGSNIR